MLDLNSPIWAELGGQDIPALIEALAKNPDEDSWNELEIALIDQGDVSGAAYAAVPHLLAIAKAQPIPLQVRFWELIGYVASKGLHHLNYLQEAVRKSCLDAFDGTKHPILEAIKAQALSEEDSLSLMQALAAVSGCYGPGRILRELLSMRGYGVQCPTCNRMLDVKVREYGAILRTDEMLTERTPRESSIPMSTIGSRVPDLSEEELTPARCSDWLPNVAMAGGHPDLARKIRTVYRNATCPECRGQFPLMEEVCRIATIDVIGRKSEDSSSVDDPNVDEEANARAMAAQKAMADLLNFLSALSKADLIRAMLVAAEVELYERALSAEVLSQAEHALSAARAWLKSPSASHEEEARLAGSQAPALIAGAAATACGRLRELAVMTCLDALSRLPPDLSNLAFARIREAFCR